MPDIEITKYGAAPQPSLTVFALHAAADQIEARLTPLCVCDKCGNWEVAATVKRAAEIVRACAESVA